MDVFHRAAPAKQRRRTSQNTVLKSRMASQYVTRTGSKPSSKMFVLRRSPKRTVDRLLIARTNGPASSDHKYPRRSVTAISGELADRPGTTTCSHDFSRGKGFRKDKSSRATQQFGTLSLQLSAL